ncbi:MAG TPA: dethiobiotin synthase [Chitinophagaceae bacterium]|nr:dethiobiotin synthase [Chitinophagaceae bacterium]
MKPIFITGIGTGVGKTVVAAIVAEALGADYWKPVQAGFAEGTDGMWVRSMTSDQTKVYPEAYKLAMAASPHIAARAEGINIHLSTIIEFFSVISANRKRFVIEGAGGLMVPLSEDKFMIDLIRALDARIILVSRNYLGSINHSLLTAAACAAHKLDVLGWIFNDQYLDYEGDIASWSGYSILASIPWAESIHKDFIAEQAQRIRPALNHLL